MKKFKFNTQASVIKGIEEKPVRKGFNWDRLIYFITLSIVLLSFGTYFINRFIKVSAESEIILDKFNVTFTDDIIVGEYFVEEGDSIGKGDSLFTYRFNIEDENNHGASISLAGINSSRQTRSKEMDNWLLKEKLNTLKNIDLKTLERNDTRRLIKDLKSKLENLKKEVFLEIYPPSKLKDAQNKISSLELKESKLTEEILFLKKYLALTEQRAIELKTPQLSPEELNASLSNGNSNNEYVFYSQKTGMVSQIYSRSKEVCYRQNLVLDVIEFQGLHIIAYFKQGDLGYIETGDKVDIEFPDGSTSKGIIDKLYVKTTTLPDRLYETGSKVERRIKAVVVPLNVEDTEKWFEFYKINVTVSKPKFL